MQITLNGRDETIEDRTTVSDILRRLRLEPIRVAVEINEDLVPRDRYAETTVHEGDRIEIVTFVGGG